MRLETWAALEHLFWPVVSRLPPSFVVSQYSSHRLDFLAKLKKEVPDEDYSAPKELKKTLWGIEFCSPIMNAAGMFKDGEGYELAVRQGAGAYMVGTATPYSTRGNEKNGVRLPFVPYRKSHSASNWLGLPNEGDEQVSQSLSRIKRNNNCPIGISVACSLDSTIEQEKKKLEFLVRGMHLYERDGMDFIEINESCPNIANTKPSDDILRLRLRYVKDNFLDSRHRKLPVIVKFSNDTTIEQVPGLVNLLVELGFDGANFGNTSTDYEKRRSQIVESERKLFDYFTKTFGGGISGQPLKEDSLRLASAAVQAVKQKSPSQEFHVIRTGGIETAADLIASEEAGISLNQWYTGYFENFSKQGLKTYKHLYEELLEKNDNKG